MGFFDDGGYVRPDKELIAELLQALGLDDSSNGGPFDKSYTSGYEYYAGLHIGVCHGPVDVVKEILFKGKLGWKGLAAWGEPTVDYPGFDFAEPRDQEKPREDGTVNTGQVDTVIINQHKLFGGEVEEGGVLGIVNILHGGRTQGINNYLKDRKKLGSKDPDKFTPAYRGILSLVFHSHLKSGKQYVPQAWLENLSPSIALFKTSKLTEPTTEHTGFYWGAMNPALKEVSVKVFRALQGWNHRNVESPDEQPPCWYPIEDPGSLRPRAIVTRWLDGNPEREKVFMNAAHIAVQCLTDLRFGMKVPFSLIGESFKRCADQLSDQEYWDVDHWEPLYYTHTYGPNGEFSVQRQCEGIGLGIVWSGENSIRAFLADIMRYINGNIYIDHTTGKLEMVLIRKVPVEEYDYLPVLGPSQIIDIGTFARPVGEEAVNTISLTYRDYDTEKTETVTRSNTAMVAIYGEVISESIDLPGIKNPQMAAEICEREVRQRCSMAGTYSRMQVTKGVPLNSTGAASVFTLYEGAPFKLTWPKHGVEEQVYRVSNINYGTMTDNFVEFDAIEDVFGLVDSTSVVGSPSSGWDDPTSIPAELTPEELKPFHVPYTLLLNAGGSVMINQLPQDTGLFGMLANTESASVTGFSLYANSGELPPSTTSEADPAYLVGSAALCPTSQLDGAMTVLSTEFPGTLQHAVRIRPDSLSRMSAETVEGAWFIVDDEKIRCVSIVKDDEDPDYLLMEVERGIYDTVPAAHADGATMWWFNGALASAAWSSYQRYTEGELVTLFAAPYGSGGGNSLSGTTEKVVDFETDNAWFAPYPPANVKINGQYFPDSVLEAGFTVEWSCRNRVTQSDVAVPWDAAGVDPEPGTTFNLRVYDPDLPDGPESRTLLDEQVGIDPFGAVGYYIYSGTPSSASRYEIELEASRNGKVSTQIFSHATQRFSGYGSSYGYNYSGSSYGGVALQFGETPPVITVANPSAGTPRPAWVAGDWISLDATVQADGGIGYTAQPSALYDFYHVVNDYQLTPATFDTGSKPYNHRLQCSVGGPGGDAVVFLSNGDSIWKRRLLTTDWTEVTKPSTDAFLSTGSTVDSITVGGGDLIVCMNKGADIYTDTTGDELASPTRHGTALLANELSELLQAEFIVKIGANYVACGKSITDHTKVAIASSTDLTAWTLRTTEAPLEALDSRNWIWFNSKYWIFTTVGDPETGSVQAVSTTNGWSFTYKNMTAPPHTPVIGRGFSYATSTSVDKLQVFAGAYVFTSENGTAWSKERTVYAPEQVMAAMASAEPFIDSWAGDDSDPAHLESRGLLFRTGRYMYDAAAPAGHPGKVFLGGLVASTGFDTPFAIGTHPEVIQPGALPYGNLVGCLGDMSVGLTNAGFDNGGTTTDDVYGFIGRKDSGKWYFEVHVGAQGPTIVGVAAATGPSEVAPVSSAILTNGSKVLTGLRLSCPGGLTGFSSNSIPFSTPTMKNAIIGVALDLDALTCTLNFDDQSGITKVVTDLTAGLAWFPVFTSVGVPLKLNLGQDLPFSLTVPGGFSPWLS